MEETNNAKNRKIMEHSLISYWVLDDKVKKTGQVMLLKFIDLILSISVIIPIEFSVPRKYLMFLKLFYILIKWRYFQNDHLTWIRMTLSYVHMTRNRMCVKKTNVCQWNPAVGVILKKLTSQRSPKNFRKRLGHVFQCVLSNSDVRKPIRRFFNFNDLFLGFMLKISGFDYFVMESFFHIIIKL